MNPRQSEPRMICGHRLELRPHGREVADGMASVLRPAPPGAGEPLPPDLRMELALGDPQPGGLVPRLPPGDEPVYRGVLLLGEREIGYHIHEPGDGRRWSVHPGVCSQYWDAANGLYRMVATPEIWQSLPMRYLLCVLCLGHLLRPHGVLSLHAGCAEVEGKGLLISAVSGGGKSSSCLALALRGAPLASDERLLVRRGPDGWLAESPSDIAKVSRQAMERFFPEMDPAAVICQEFGDNYFSLEALGVWRRGETPVGAICCVQKTGLERSTWEPMAPARAVPSLFPVTIPLGNPRTTKEVFQGVMQLLGEVPCFALKAGTDMDGLAEATRSLARGL